MRGAERTDGGQGRVIQSNSRSQKKIDSMERRLLTHAGHQRLIGEEERWDEVVPWAKGKQLLNQTGGIYSIRAEGAAWKPPR